MDRIFKHELKGAVTDIELPEDFSVLSAQMQKDKLMLWIRTDVENSDDRTEKKRFYVIPTGQAFPEDAEDLTYISTVIDGDYVWHIWEKDDSVEEDD